MNVLLFGTSHPGPFLSKETASTVFKKKKKNVACVFPFSLKTLHAKKLGRPISKDSDPGVGKDGW